MAEVANMLYQLGIRACPVHGSTETLIMSPFPVLLFDAEVPPGSDDISPGEEHHADVTFAVRVECATCGHLALCNAQKYRTADETILVRDLTDGERRQLGH
jgi:hypothetical protein